MEFQIKATLADEYGTRMDTYMGPQLIGWSFTLADKRSQYLIFPEKKKYIEVALTEENRIENGDPKHIVEAFLQGDYKKLGSAKSTVLLSRGSSPTILTHSRLPRWQRTDGGTGGSSARVPGSLWADVDTGWPVEITLDIADENGNEQMTIVVSDFQWDAKIDPATFASVIPEGYALMYKVNAERLEEGQQLIDGLKYFAQINDGEYPAELSIR